MSLLVFPPLGHVRPHAGAWVGIFPRQSPGQRWQVRPRMGTWVGMMARKYSTKCRSVRPRMGAWVGISGTSSRAGCRGGSPPCGGAGWNERSWHEMLDLLVRPHTGMWVGISQASKPWPPHAFTPHTGVWVGITCVQHSKGVFLCSPPCGGVGWNFSLFLFRLPCCGSPPYGGVGWNSKYRISTWDKGICPHTGGVG